MEEEKEEGLVTSTSSFLHRLYSFFGMTVDEYHLSKKSLMPTSVSSQEVGYHDSFSNCDENIGKKSSDDAESKQVHCSKMKKKALRQRNHQGEVRYTTYLNLSRHVFFCADIFSFMIFAYERLPAKVARAMGKVL